MTASAPIVGTLRAIPDAASATPQDSEVPAHANFRSVLEQYHVPHEKDSNADDAESTPKQKQKDSDPTVPLALPQAVTPVAEAPRLILPFATSLVLRQGATASPNDSALQAAAASADDPTTAQDSTAATANPKAASAPAMFRSILDPHSFYMSNGGKTNSALAETPPGTQAKSHSELQVKVMESAPAQTFVSPTDPFPPLLLVTTATTLGQAATPVKTSSTVDEVPDSARAIASTIDRGAFILTDSRKVAYQYHSSHEADSTTAVTSSTAQQQPKVSDVTATIAVPVPISETLDRQRTLYQTAVSNTPKQDIPVSQSSSSVTQDSSVASLTDSKTVMLPAIEQASDTTAAPPSGPIAFAAKLTPEEETPAPAPDSSRPTDSQSRVQTAPLGTARQFTPEADVPADPHSGGNGNQPDKENRFAKPEMVLPQNHATFQDLTAASSHAPTSPLSPAARMDQVQDPPARAPGGNHDITIRIPGSNTDQGTAVRFVERAGEVHVSVRTGDAEMAQTLRGGLNDLVTHLEDGGIRTQVWQPGADASTSHNDSQQPFADPDGSHSRQFSSGSNSERESEQQNKPRWVEELESSIGNSNFKETPLLWQA